MNLPEQDHVNGGRNMEKVNHGCRTNEYYSNIILSTDGTRRYNVIYGQYHRLRDNKVIWKWQCECKGYLVHRRTCKHIKEAQKDYCGWQENKNFEPAACIDENSGEATCPLCGDLAYPLTELKNLYGDNNE